MGVRCRLDTLLAVALHDKRGRVSKTIVSLFSSKIIGEMFARHECTVSYSLSKRSLQ